MGPSIPGTDSLAGSITTGLPGLLLPAGNQYCMSKLRPEKLGLQNAEVQPLIIVDFGEDGSGHPAELGGTLEAEKPWPRLLIKCLVSALGHTCPVWSF